MQFSMYETEFDPQYPINQAWWCSTGEVELRGLEGFQALPQLPSEYEGHPGPCETV